MSDAQVTSPLQPPIFVVDGLDVSLYPTIEAAILSVEGVDVADGVYQVFDADGRRITLRAAGDRRESWCIDIGTVHFDRAETTPTGDEELRRLLREHLAAVGVSPDQDGGLPALVRLVEQFHLT